MNSNSVFPEISVALVEPSFPMNVGYVARVMANFGLRRLYLVAGKGFKTIDIDEIARFASHGQNIVSEMKWSKSLDALKQKFHILVGTTAIRGKRKSNITRKTLEIEECADALASFAKRKPGNERVCIVFGRDTTGMTNDELRKCDYIVSITTGSKYNTLNISNAAAIIFYSLLHGLKKQETMVSLRKTQTASRKEKDRVISLFEDLASLSDFQKHKSPRLRETLERLLNRSNPSTREIYLLMGLASRADSKIRRLSSFQEQKR